tara:strand:- start:5761 stop:6030 length:270 start_codon:yes stop_codon:yes gene_type:complete
MMTYIVIGICLFLLIAVIYVSAKPISMGIEARRSLNDINKDNISNEEDNYILDEDKNSLSEEIIKLNKLKSEGLLTKEEFEKAKKKILG